jgi:hypothetical protein
VGWRDTYHCIEERHRQGRALFPKGQACRRGGYWGSKGQHGLQGQRLDKGRAHGRDCAAQKSPVSSGAFSSDRWPPAWPAPEAQKHNTGMQRVGRSWCNRGCNLGPQSSVLVYFSSRVDRGGVWPLVNPSHCLL